jgi:hypothetical protein
MSARNVVACALLVGLGPALAAVAACAAGSPSAPAPPPPASTLATAPIDAAAAPALVVVVVEERAIADAAAVPSSSATLRGHVGRGCQYSLPGVGTVDCDPRWQRCCENVRTHVTTCINIEEKTGAGESCFADEPGWVSVMDCLQFTECGKAQRCCREPAAAAAGITKTVCEAACSDAGAEACVAYGTCAAGQACVRDDDARWGGACTAPGTRAPRKGAKPVWTSIAGPPQDRPCPRGYVPAIYDRLCHRECGAPFRPSVCGAEEECNNDRMRGPMYCRFTTTP